MSLGVAHRYVNDHQLAGHLEGGLRLRLLSDRGERRKDD